MSNSTIQINYPSPKRYVHTQTEPSSYWSVKHNFGYKYCVVTVANSASEVLIPSSIKLYDNGLAIIFDDENPQSGYAIVTGIDYGLGNYRKITKEVIEKTDDYTITSGDDKIVFVSETDTQQRFYLPDTSTVSAGFVVNISKIGTGNVYIEPTSAAIIENGPSGSYIVNTSENQSYISLMKMSDNLWSRTGSWNNWVSSMSRGLFLAGLISAVTNVIDYITITTTGNAIDFGDTLNASRLGSAGSNFIRGMHWGYYTSAAVNNIDYITISTLGNALDFGDLSLTRAYSPANNFSPTRGCLCGGYSTYNTIDYITVSTLGNALDFGDLITGTYYIMGLSSITRGIQAGGVTINTISYITIASTGNALDFGDLLAAIYYGTAGSSTTRGIILGGYDVNVIQYITIATLGNAIDFGDLSFHRYYCAGFSSLLRAVIGGGYTPNNNIIEYVTISTLGNAVDFGDLTVARYYVSGGLSDCHGGLG